MRIDCPFCGLRSIEEFEIRGDAGPPRPDLDAGEEAYYRYVYIRENPKGHLIEHWHHGGGCGQWLVVARDTLTHEVSDVRPAKNGAEEQA